VLTPTITRGSIEIILITPNLRAVFWSLAWNKVLINHSLGKEIGLIIKANNSSLFSKTKIQLLLKTIVKV
jgi:hypothetical protein